VYWMYGILIEDHFGMDAKTVGQRLHEQGVDTRSFFTPMHAQPVFQKEDAGVPSVSGGYPVADQLCKKGLYLPSSSSLTDKQITYISEILGALRQ